MRLKILQADLPLRRKKNVFKYALRHCTHLTLHYIRVTISLCFIRLRVGRTEYRLEELPPVCQMRADPGVRGVQDVGLQPLVLWDWEFEFRRGHWWPLLVFVCCVDSGPATSWSLVQRSPSGYVCVSNCVWSRNLNNQAAWARFGLFCHSKTYRIKSYFKRGSPPVWRLNNEQRCRILKI